MIRLHHTFHLLSTFYNFNFSKSSFISNNNNYPCPMGLCLPCSPYHHSLDDDFPKQLELFPNHPQHNPYHKCSLLP